MTATALPPWLVTVKTGCSHVWMFWSSLHSVFRWVRDYIFKSSFWSWTYSHPDSGQHSPDSGISESHLLSPVPLAVCHCHWCHLGHCMCSSKFLEVSYHKHISGIHPLLSISGSQTTRCGSPPVCPAVGPSLRHCPGQAPDLGPGVCLQEESNHERGEEKPTRYKVQKVLN